jgi:Zn ribbon nucleic-acid-binding protein
MKVGNKKCQRCKYNETLQVAWNETHVEFIGKCVVCGHNSATTFIDHDEVVYHCHTCRAKSIDAARHLGITIEEFKRPPRCKVEI